jgi:surfactin synthase thioesterase subunit
MPVTASEVDGLWFRRFQPGDPDATRLICFPYAGGAASYYFPLARALAPGLEVYAVQYPGRQDRRREPCFEGIAPLADAVADAMDGLLDRPFAFFGHSMGAVVAFEVALRLRARLDPGPVRLFASGRRAPSALRTETVHRRDDDGLIAELIRLGGTDRRSMQDEDIRAMTLPPVRADYAAIETYRLAPGTPRLECPITVLSGSSDPHTTPAELAAWAEHTTDEPEFHEFPGGHFFLDAERTRLAALIRDSLIRDSLAGTGAHSR